MPVPLITNRLEALNTKINAIKKRTMDVEKEYEGKYKSNRFYRLMSDYKDQFKGVINEVNTLGAEYNCLRVIGVYQSKTFVCYFTNLSSEDAKLLIGMRLKDPNVIINQIQPVELGKLEFIEFSSK